MDCLAGRKTGGRITGDIKVNGFEKNGGAFARVMGYCEQTGALQGGNCDFDNAVACVIGYFEQTSASAVGPDDEAGHCAGCCWAG